MSWVRVLRLLALAAFVVCLGVSFLLHEELAAVAWIVLPAACGAPGVWRGRTLPATLALLGGGVLIGAAVLREHPPGLAAAALIALLWQWDLACLEGRLAPYGATADIGRLVRVHLAALAAASASAAVLFGAAVLWRPTTGIWSAFWAGLIVLIGIAQTVRYLLKSDNA